MGLGMKVVIKRHLAGDKLEGGNAVSQDQSIVILQINLMLARRNLMVSPLHADSHLFECRDNLLASQFTAVSRREIEISDTVMGHGCRLAIAFALKEKELDLNTDSHSQAQLPVFVQSRLQAGSRASIEPASLRLPDITDQACDPPVG